MFGKDRRRIVMRKPGEKRYVFFGIITPYGGGSVMFWSAVISLDRTKLVLSIYNDYTTKILIPTTTNAIFIDDNAQHHLADKIDAYLTESQSY